MNGHRFLYASTALALFALRAPEKEQGAEGPQPSMTPEVHVGSKPTASVTLGEDRKTFKSEGAHQSGIQTSFGADGSVETTEVQDNLGDEPEAEDDGEPQGDEETGEEAADKDDEAQPGEDADGELEALPDYDPASEETVAAYDERYFSEVDGKPVLNIDRLGEVVYANSQKEGGKPELNAGEYAYLQDRLGLSREVIDEHIALRIEGAQTKEAAFYSSVGGKENWEGMLAWGRENYTPAQRAKFNAVLKAEKSDPDAVAEQVELLMSRAEKGGYKSVGPKRDGKEPEPQRKGPSGAPRAKKPASPPKSASGSEVRTAGKANTYANNDEYVAALRKAGTDPNEIRKVRENLAASDFWKPNRKG